jgi:alpha-glucoside transport system permease protein
MFGKRLNLIPWLFVFPGVFVLFIFLIAPTLRTAWLSFHEGSFFNPTSQFVGVEHFVALFVSDSLFFEPGWPGGAVTHTLLWLILFPALTIVIGMTVAVLSDGKPYEPVIQTIVFVPMVISATAASVIFRFVYSVDPDIGVINAVLTAILPGFEPIPWLGRQSLVNFAVIGAGVWIWTGLAMIVLSSSYKGLPQEVLDQAAVDGATPWQTFWRVSLPMLAGPLTFVAVAMIINALKLVEVILVMTQGGPRGASRTIGFTVYWEIFRNGNIGYGSAVAVILFILVIPIMIVQVRRIRAEESMR